MYNRRPIVNKSKKKSINKFDRNSTLGRVNASQRYDSFSPGMETGEITGMYVNNKEFEKGMPMRNFVSDSLKQDKSDYQFMNTRQSHLDFDLYDEKSDIDVSYYDPSSVYSSIGETKLTNNASLDDSFMGVNLPVKKQKDGFPLMVNSFGLDLFVRLMTKVDLSKNIGLSPYFILSLLSVLFTEKKSEKDMTSIFGDVKKELFYNFMKNVPPLKSLNIYYNDNFGYLKSEDEKKKYYSKICMFLGYKNIEGRKFIDMNNMINSFFNTNKQSYLEKELTVVTKRDRFQYISILKFDPILMVDDISEDDFYGLNKKSTVEYARMNYSQFPYVEDSLHQLLEIPINDSLSLGFIKSRTKHFNKLSPKMFQSYLDTFELRDFDLVHLPIFSFKKVYKINGLLNDIGLASFKDSFDKFKHFLDFQVRYKVTKEPTRRSGNKGMAFVLDSSFYYYLRYGPFIVYIGKVSNL